jgi:hypothetical protein
MNDCPNNRQFNYKLQMIPLHIPSPPESDLIASEPVESDLIASEPVESDLIASEPVESEPVESEPVESEPVESEPVESEPVESEPVESDPVKSDLIASDPVVYDPVESDPVKSDPVKSATTIVNRGMGAGGANTNKTGKRFEDNTDNLARMCGYGYGFVRHLHWVEKQYVDKRIIISKQRDFSQCVKHQYGISHIYRWPDEAYIIEYLSGRKIIKILEKKMQNREGSVETKIFAGPSLKREYELMFGSAFEVQYGFCVSGFLQKKMTSGTKKYNNLLQILKEHNISVLFGDDANYFETLDLWIHSL